MHAALGATRNWLATVPAGEPVAVAFSGGIDSTAVCCWPAARRRIWAAIPICCVPIPWTLAAAPTRRRPRPWPGASVWTRTGSASRSPKRSTTCAEAIVTIEDYHPLDVECAAAALCLLRALRLRHPRLRYLIDGDGGDENLKSYPLEDSDLTLSSVLRNPLLYQEGWGIDAIKHSQVYSGGLSRGYVRTFMRRHRATASTRSRRSPCRSVIAEAPAIPFEPCSAAIRRGSPR